MRNESLLESGTCRAAPTGFIMYETLPSVTPVLRKSARARPLDS